MPKGERSRSKESTWGESLGRRGGTHVQVIPELDRSLPVEVDLPEDGIGLLDRGIVARLCHRAFYIGPGDALVVVLCARQM